MSIGAGWKVDRDDREGQVHDGCRSGRTVVDLMAIAPGGSMIWVAIEHDRRHRDA